MRVRIYLMSEFTRFYPYDTFIFYSVRMIIQIFDSTATPSRVFVGK